MSYFFIINPGSKQKRGANFIPVLLTELKNRKIDFEYKSTETLEDAYNLSKAANEKGYEVVVAVGGDGTINKVINGFYGENGNRISNAKLGVIHTGTSPDFCRSYGIPTKPSLALETVLKGFTKEISVARIEFNSIFEKNRIGYFACCASVGVGAQVAQMSNSGIRKFLGDALGTFVSIIISLGGYKSNDLKMLCDGKQEIIKKNFNTFIGKTSFIASGMKVYNNLANDDNRLYVLSIKRLNLLNIVPVLKAIYSGKPLINKDYLSFKSAANIDILNGKTCVEVEFDGDPQGFLPCKITVAQDKLELISNEL